LTLANTRDGGGVWPAYAAASWAAIFAAGTGLLVLRTAAGTIQWFYWMATSRFSLEAIGIWQP
jgi:hypothetical protein